MTWTCINPACGHVVISNDRPEAIKWTDGHTCFFRPEEEEEDPPPREDKEREGAPATLGEYETEAERNR